MVLLLHCRKQGDFEKDAAGFLPDRECLSYKFFRWSLGFKKQIMYMIEHLTPSLIRSLFSDIKRAFLTLQKKKNEKRKK